MKMALPYLEGSVCHYDLLIFELRAFVCRFSCRVIIESKCHTCKHTQPKEGFLNEMVVIA